MLKERFSPPNLGLVKSVKSKDMKNSPKIIIFLTVFIYLVGFGMIIPIIPLLGRDFGASSLQVGLLMSVYSLMQFVFAPFWGHISDRYGRRPVILFCLFGEGLSYIYFTQAGNLEHLFIARILSGVFSGSISTASAYISDITPPEERSKGMALIGVAFGLGFIFGPAIGGLLTLWAKTISQAPHFESSFAAWWVAGLCFLNFIFALKFLKESLHPDQLSTEKSTRWQRIIKYFKVETLNSMLLVFFIGSLSMSIMEATLILYMGEKFQWTIKEVSFGFAYVGVIAILTQGFFVRKYIPKFGEKRVLAFGLTFMTIGYLGISFAPNLAIMGIVMTFLAVGNGFTNPSTLGSISLLVGPKEQGAALGVAQSMASLGRIIGPALGGWIYGSHIRLPFIISASAVLLGLSIVIKKFAQIPETGKTKAMA